MTLGSILSSDLCTVKTKIPAYVNDDKEKKGVLLFAILFGFFSSSLLHSSESKAAGGPAESGRADVAAGSHQTSELVSYLGLSGLNLHRQEIYIQRDSITRWKFL
jgi:hypothetical protein